MATITVGHVDVDGLWVEFQADSSLTAQEVIVRSGMKPRDGTLVDCYLTSGEIVADSVAPGQTVMVGTHPPRGGAVAISPRLRHFEVKWAKEHESEGGRRLVTGSGYIGGGCTMWVPGVSSVRKIRAVELMRVTNRNGKLHAKGHRVRWDPMPYYGNDIALVASSGVQQFRLFDPQTSDLTIPVTIVPESLERAKRAEAVLGSRFLWTIRVLNFDAERRRVLASVEEGYTWEGAESGTIGASHATHAKGKVATTNPELNFVVLDFKQHETPPAGRKFSIHRAGRKVGRVRVVGPAWETYTVASIIEGDFRIGDEGNEEAVDTERGSDDCSDDVSGGRPIYQERNPRGYW